MNEEEKKWEDEATELVEKYYIFLNNDSRNGFRRGYLQACRKRQEEIERLKEEIKILENCSNCEWFNEETK